MAHSLLDPVSSALCYRFYSLHGRSLSLIHIYAEADFADNLIEDHEIRTYLKKRLYSAGISKIEIERASDRIKIIVHTAKPGVVIGKGGAEIEKLKAEVQKMTDKKLFVDIKEVKRPDRDAQLVACLLYTSQPLSWSAAEPVHSP